MEENSIKIDVSVIEQTPNDLELGKKIREIFNQSLAVNGEEKESN